jgi:hypothetical protein
MCGATEGNDGVLSSVGEIMTTVVVWARAWHGGDMC